MRVRFDVSPRIAMTAAGLALLAVPTGFFCLFAVGEAAGGDLSGLSHLLQALPLVLLGLAAFRWPTASGAILLVVGLAAMIAYVATTADRVAAASIVIVEVVLAFPVVSGILLLMAGRSPRERTA